MLIVVIEATSIMRYHPFLGSAKSDAEENISLSIYSHILIGKLIHKLRENLVAHDGLSEVLTVICKAAKSKGCSLLYTWYLDNFKRRSLFRLGVEQYNLAVSRLCQSAHII